MRLGYLEKGYVVRGEPSPINEGDRGVLWFEYAGESYGYPAEVRWDSTVHTKGENAQYLPLARGPLHSITFVTDLAIPVEHFPSDRAMWVFVPDLSRTVNLT